MASVTQRVKQASQPRGGYVDPKAMEVRYLGRDGAAVTIDHTAENVHVSLVGMAVDYLTRVAIGRPATEVFDLAVVGATRLGGDWSRYALELCQVVDGSRRRVFALPDAESARFFAPNLKNPQWATAREVYLVPDSQAITAAVKLSNFSAVVRAGLAAYNPDANTDPDETTIEHISSMVGASLFFMWEYGPVMVDGFTMFGGYTETIDSGDGDFITLDTLWDFKVSVKPPTKVHTLQLLVYWLMARRSDWNWRPTWNWDRTMPEADWREVWDLDDYLAKNRAWPNDLRGPVPTHLGVYNPRLDAVYRIAVERIPGSILAAVERDVIGY